MSMLAILGILVYEARTIYHPPLLKGLTVHAQQMQIDWYDTYSL